MKYTATLNGKQYEVELERIDAYEPMPRYGEAPAATPAPVAAPAAPAPAPAPQVKLEGVSEVEAACVMAIVSHETGIPLDQLVFKSIKAV